MTDQLDIELHERLIRVAAAVPVEPPSLMGSVTSASVHAGPTTRRLALGGVVPILAVAVIGTLLAGLAKVGPFAPGASSADGPVVATDTRGAFSLTIRSAEAVYYAGDPIDVSASLAFAGPAASVQISHGLGANDGPLGFGVIEPVDVPGLGLINLGGGYRLACVSSIIQRGAAIVAPYSKGGGPVLDQRDGPSFEELQTYMSDRVLRLPVGIWHIYALAQFETGDCASEAAENERYELRAEITIEVVPAPAEASTQPKPADGMVVASTTDQGFELVIRSAKARYAPGEAIEIAATLAYLGQGPVVIRHAQGATVPGRGSVDGADTGGTGGPIGFGIVEPVLGDLRLGTGWDLSCEGSTLEPGKELTVPFQKGGGWSGEDPRSEEYRAYVLDPVLRLAAGTWHIYAIAEFSIGECDAAQITMRVDLTIEVGDTTPDTSEATAAPTTGPEGSASPIQPDGSVLGVASDESFELRLRAVSGTGFTAGTPIDLLTTYEYLGPELPESVIVGHFEPEIAFGIEQLGVENNLIRGKIYDSDCSERELSTGVPVAVPFSDGNLMSIEAVTVGGTFNAALEEGHLSLPVGRWRITAYLDTYLSGCPADSEAGHHALEVSIEIYVVSDASVEIGLRTASGPYAGDCPAALGGGTLARNPRTGLGFEDSGIVTDVIWPYGWTARSEGKDIVLYNAEGDAEAAVGDQVAFGGGHIGPDGDSVDTFAICGPIIAVVPN